MSKDRTEVNAARNLVIVKKEPSLDSIRLALTPPLMRETADAIFLAYLEKKALFSEDEQRLIAQLIYETDLLAD